ncbi:hypothetical protein CBL_07123 [Carabus blaptoides fortunei]
MRMCPAHIVEGNPHIVNLYLIYNGVEYDGACRDANEHAECTRAPHCFSHTCIISDIQIYQPTTPPALLKHTLIDLLFPCLRPEQSECWLSQFSPARLKYENAVKFNASSDDGVFNGGQGFKHTDTPG